MWRHIRKVIIQQRHTPKCLISLLQSAGKKKITFFYSLKKKHSVLYFVLFLYFTGINQRESRCARKRGQSEMKHIAVLFEFFWKSFRCSLFITNRL